MKRALILCLLLVFSVSLAGAESLQIYVEGGPSQPLRPGGTVPEASLRLMTAQSEWLAVFVGVVERMTPIETTLQSDTGRDFALSAELPVRFGFFGADGRIATEGAARIEAGTGLVIFDKMHPQDGTLWRIHITLYGVLDVGRAQFRIGLHHFSNGSKTFLKSPSPNKSLEFATLGVGIVVPL